MCVYKEALGGQLWRLEGIYLFGVSERNLLEEVDTRRIKRGSHGKRKGDSKDKR